MRHLPLADLPGSKLFKDVLDHPEQFFDRSTVDTNLITARSKQGASRTRLRELIERGMASVELTEQQQRNLDLLANGTATVVVTGQQVGFLGGPLYTLIKIRSAAQAATELSTDTSTPVVPVFWLEDNDHDAAEASAVTLPSLTTSHWDGVEDRIPVHQRHFSPHELEIVDSVLQHLDGQHADAVRSRLTTIYHGTSAWADAFISVLQPYLGEWGVLVIRGSDVVSSGLHAPIIDRDLQLGGELERVMEERTDDLVAKGYHAQATIGGVSFFMLVNGERHRILRDGDRYRVGDLVLSSDEIMQRARTNPSEFTPSVLARPLVQDAVLPSIATVLGPGEIAYQAQITPAYKLVGIPQPVVLPRHMACVLDNKSERNLSKVGKDVEWFFRSWEDIDRSVTDELQAGADVPDVDGDIINSWTDPWLKAAKVIDPTLEKTVASATAGIRASLEGLTGKLRSALKKKNAETLERFRGLWSMVYPNATMNERVYPLAFWQARLGDDLLRIIVERICRNARTTLTIIGPTDAEDAAVHSRR